MQNENEVVIECFNLVVEMLRDYKNFLSQNNLHKKSLEYSHWIMNSSYFGYKKSFCNTIKYMLNDICISSNIGISIMTFDSEPLFYTFDSDSSLEDRNIIKNIILESIILGTNSLSINRYKKELNEIRKHFYLDRSKCITNNLRNIRIFNEYVEICNDLIEYFNQLLESINDKTKNNYNEKNLIIFKNKLLQEKNNGFIQVSTYDMDEQTGCKFIFKVINKISEGIKRSIPDKKNIEINEHEVIYNEDDAIWKVSIRGRLNEPLNIKFEYKNSKEKYLSASVCLYKGYDDFDLRRNVIKFLEIQEIEKIILEHTRDMHKKIEDESKSIIDSI